MSTIGPKPKCRDVRDLVEIGWKADMKWTSPEVRVWPMLSKKADLSRAAEASSVGLSFGRFDGGAALTRQASHDANNAADADNSRGRFLGGADKAQR